MRFGMLPGESKGEKGEAHLEDFPHYEKILPFIVNVRE
jgi:hypothetical protein